MRPQVFVMLLAGACQAAWAQADGFWPVIGGLPFDSGFALGVQYRNASLFDGQAQFRARAVVSVRRYEHGELWFSLPHLAGDRIFAELTLRYRNYPEENFWGIGPKTPRAAESNYRLEDFRYGATVGLRPRRWLQLGAAAGMTRVNAGPGQDRHSPSIEQRFAPAAVPALEQQPDYYDAGLFARVDYRNREESPSAGGLYEARFSWFGDRELARYSFRRYTIDLRQFFPARATGGVIALRGLAWFSETRPGQQVPFYLLATAGGGNDLRGFRQYRFRDRHALILNAEYRHPVHRYVDVVGFADAGRVSSRREELGLSGFEASAGFGSRVKFRGRMLVGIDFGFSREGFRWWIRSAELF